ncbi:MAG: M14 family metallopeptidase [Acidobacteriota bacterium]|jgi:hypothetical protein
MLRLLRSHSRSPLQALAALLAAAALAGASAALAAPLDGTAAGATADRAPGESVLPTEVDLGYYLAALPGAAAGHDPDVPAPRSSLGFEVGEWHARPAQLVEYLERLAGASDRVAVEETGRTHERKPQVVAVVTSPENRSRLDEILERHRARTEPPFGDGPEEAAAPDDLPAVVYLGYSIHGNEASGSNASMVVAYHLAASRSDEVASLLDRLVILLDPSLNPDGMGRFAHWANMHRGAVPVADPEHREHVESWPSGRTNHYWFDLNRDWLLLVHPESRNRVRLFQHWRPNVLADFHEMGARSTYFFQPGVPSRQNPLTPRTNVELTREFARYHARALDTAGSLYYTEETFDDFYFGKGSTYPDIQGTIGILFEQASARGHVQEGEQGPLTFPFAIRNQAITSFSTLQAAADHREDLLAYQERFFREALAEAGSSPIRAYAVGSGGDRARLHELAELLRHHGIRVHRLAAAVEAGGERFEPGSSLIIPTRQRQKRLLEALFERRVEFEDTTFYDVSAWTMPLAFGLPWAELGPDELSADLVGEPVGEGSFPAGAMAGTDEVDPTAEPATDPVVDPVAWAFEWTGYYAPRALGRLLGEGVFARVATRPFEAHLEAGSPGGGEGSDLRAFDRGTIVVPLGLQRDRAGEIRGLLETAAREDGVTVHALASGLTPGGIDLGSPSLEPIEPPRPLLLVGHHVSSYDAGEIWHLLDHRFRIPVSLVERDRLGRIDLDRYTHVILVDGRWDELPESDVAALEEWVLDGGTLIGIQHGATWAGRALLGLGENGEGNGMNGMEIQIGGSSDSGGSADDRPYADFRKDVAVPLIAGTIFEARLDRTHPLAYGYTRDLLPVFRDWTGTLVPTGNPYDTPVRYTDRPLLAGYVSLGNLANLSGQPAVIATRLGEGVVIRMVDDPNFRGIWYGTSRLMLNAIYLSGAIRSTDVPEGVKPRE